MTTSTIKEKELCTILAALRNFQDLININDMQYVTDSFEHFQDGTEPLTSVEIDELCERLTLSY